MTYKVIRLGNVICCRPQSVQPNFSRHFPPVLAETYQDKVGNPCYSAVWTYNATRLSDLKQDSVSVEEEDCWATREKAKAVLESDPAWVAHGPDCLVKYESRTQNDFDFEFNSIK